MPFLIEKRDRLQQQAEALAQIYRVVRLAKPFSPKPTRTIRYINIDTQPNYKRDSVSNKNLIGKGYELICIVVK